MPIARRFFFCIVWLSCSFAQAKEIYNYRWNYSLNLPANWLPEFGNDGDSLQRFRSADKRLAIEVRAWKRREAKSLNAMYINHLQQLSGTGKAQRYQHMGYVVLLARIEYDDPHLKETSPPTFTGEDLAPALQIQGEQITVYSKGSINAKTGKEQRRAIKMP